MHRSIFSLYHCTPTTFLLISPHHLQFFNLKKSSVVEFPTPVHKALVYNQYLFAMSRTQIVKINLTNVERLETTIHDMDIMDIVILGSRLTLVHDTFVAMQDGSAEHFGRPIVSADANDAYLFVVLSDESIYRCGRDFEYLRRVRDAFEIRAREKLFLANKRTMIDVMDVLSCNNMLQLD